MGEKQRYLGDGVYAEAEDSGMIAIYTNDSYGHRNTIWLEPDVLGALNAFAAQAWGDPDGQA